MSEIGAMKDIAGSAVAATVGIALICAGAYGIISSGIPAVAVRSFSSHIARQDVEAHRVEKVGRIYRDEAYQAVCPSYFDASWIKRHTTLRGKSWCEDYADKY